MWETKCEKSRAWDLLSHHQSLTVHSSTHREYRSCLYQCLHGLVWSLTLYWLCLEHTQVMCTRLQRLDGTMVNGRLSRLGSGLTIVHSRFAGMQASGNGGEWSVKKSVWVGCEWCCLKNHNQNSSPACYYYYYYYCYYYYCCCYFLRIFCLIGLTVYFFHGAQGLVLGTGQCYRRKRLRKTLRLIWIVSDKLCVWCMILPHFWIQSGAVCRPFFLFFFLHCGFIIFIFFSSHQLC